MIMHKTFLPVFARIDAILQQNPSPVIGIDGPCASGKTTAAALLASIYSCNVVHADSFFLPLNLRTKNRLLQPGGNIDYERLHTEILAKLPAKDTLIYKIFSCKTMSFDSIGTISPRLPIIIEGSYSLHPFFENKYDLRVFVTAPQDLRLERLAIRESPESLEMFKSKWIIYENNYFEKYKIKESCQVIVETK